VCERVPRDLVRSEWEEVTGDRRKLQNKEVYDLYCLINIIQVLKIEDVMGGACSTYGDERKIIHDSGGEKPECKRPPRKPGRGRENNIKMYLK